MTRKEIVLHYARTWFIVDIMTVGVEWAGLIMQGVSRGEDGMTSAEVRSLFFFCKKDSSKKVLEQSLSTTVFLQRAVFATKVAWPWLT